MPDQKEADLVLAFVAQLKKVPGEETTENMVRCARASVLSCLRELGGVGVWLARSRVSLDKGFLPHSACCEHVQTSQGVSRSFLLSHRLERRSLRIFSDPV